MKKVLSLMGLIAILSMVNPVYAAPGGPGGPGGHGGSAGHGGHGIASAPHQAAPLKPSPHVAVTMHGGVGMHQPAPPPHRHFTPAPPPPQPVRIHYYNRGSAVFGGVLARRSYWCDSYYNYRLGWYDPYYCVSPPPIHYGNGVYLNFGIPIHF